MKRLLALLLLFSACKPDAIELSYQLYHLPTDLDLRHIYFVNADTGYIAAGERYGRGILFATTDGGETWNEQIDQAQDFSFIGGNGQSLHLLSSSGTMLRSTNGGVGWSGVSMSDWTFWHRAAFRSDGSGLVIGGKNQGEGYIQLFAANYQFVRDDSTKNEWRDVCYTDDATAHIVGYGAVYKSTDGGDTWQPSEARGDDFRRVQFVSASVGYVLGWYGAILKTTDGGENWQRIRKANTLTSRRQNDMFWLDEQQGYLVGNNGLIEKTTDGGEHWQPIPNDETADWNALFLLDNKLFVVGNNGWYLRLEV